MRIAGALSMAILFVGAALAGESGMASKRKGPLAKLPSAPGAHIAKIKALGDNQWLNLGAPKPDPKWGKARGRAWSAHMAYAPELRAAFIMGEGVHAWYNKKTNRYMDDLFVYDVNAHRWICLHPGTDIKKVSLKLDANGFEVDKDGQPIPVAQLCHAFEQITYDTDRRKFMFVTRPSGDWRGRFGKRRLTWLKGRRPGDAGAAVNCSPWMYNTVTGKFELFKTKPPCPYPGSADVARYVPAQKALFYWKGRGEAWTYDIRGNTWTKLAPKGPPPPFGCDASACLDLKRNRIYMGGGYYPVAKGPNALWCYDFKTNAWMDLKPKGKACGGSNRYGPNHAMMSYDSAHDVVVLFYYRPDPGPKGRGIYVYHPATNSWGEKALDMPKGIAQCPSGFYSARLNAYFIHCAGDSQDNGTMWAYRYKRKTVKR